MNTNKTEEEIFSMIAGKAFTDFYVIQEIKQKVSLIGDEESDEYEAIQEEYRNSDDPNFGKIIINGTR